MNILNVFIASIITVLLTSCGGGGGGGDGSKTANGLTVKLEWVPPSTRTNGAYLPVSNLRGYRIYHGSSSESLELILDIEDSSVTDYEVTLEDPGVHYFAVTAYDTNDLESAYSQILEKKI